MWQRLRDLQLNSKKVRFQTITVRDHTLPCINENIGEAREAKPPNKKLFLAHSLKCIKFEYMKNYLYCISKQNVYNINYNILYSYNNIVSIAFVIKKRTVNRRI